MEHARKGIISPIRVKYIHGLLLERDIIKMCNEILEYGSMGKYGASEFFLDYFNWAPPTGPEWRRGVSMILTGLVKKLVFADNFAASADRYFLQRARGLEEVGVYAVAVKFFAVAMMGVSAFSLAFFPFAHARADDQPSAEGGGRELNGAEQGDLGALDDLRQRAGDQHRVRR